MVNLITTDSYYNLFDLLMHSLKECSNDISNKKIIFCEEKVSLMIERRLCKEFGGTFNTEIYSFGNFLRVEKPMNNLLSKEGSSMVVKKILSSVSLKCFKASKTSIAPTLYNLIIQLKSAKILPTDIKNAIDKTQGVLKNKLQDIFTIYSEYERFVLENGFEDQSSYLSHLPQVINDSQKLTGAKVFLVGFTGFTAQIRSAIQALVERTNDVTAILCKGENPLAFVNETAEFIVNLCKAQDYPLISRHYDSDYNKSAKVIIENVFCPSTDKKELIDQKEQVFCCSAPNALGEVERVAQIIKSKVNSGECRYRDMTIAIPDSTYSLHLENVLREYEIPYFLDQRKKVEHHPLIKLVLSYVEVLRKNFERKEVLKFVKNPYFCCDQRLLDNFENYIIKYNVNYLKFKKDFTFCESENLDELNALRQKFISLFGEFNVLKLFKSLDVENKTEQFVVALESLGQFEESAINKQIYQAVIDILSQMQLLLNGLSLSLNEYKSVFTSGVNSLEMSIIPQYNDAVFIGEYKQTALVKANYLFAVGITNDVPNIQPDVALLSDDDICALEEIKVMVEPKINVVNHRNRESFALALCAFSKGLFVSYPAFNLDGAKSVKSEVVSMLTSLVKCKDFPDENGYLTKKQGLKAFANECSKFADGSIIDFEKGCSYYSAVCDNKVEQIVDRANKKIQIQLDDKKEVLVDKYISPTTIEDYYKCPYKAFLSRALKISEREVGEVNVLSVGNLMHEIFDKYTRNLDKVSDEQSSNALFEQIAFEILQREEYKKYLSDSVQKATIDRVLKESKKYCFMTFKSFENSLFKVADTEVKFGDGCFYPAISLNDGSVKIKGKIDRVDQSEKYFRVLDYKTGSTDSTDKSLFAGIKLQLFLYAAAVGAKYSGEKSVAGLYYLPISDKYNSDEPDTSPMSEGRTLGNEDALFAQDTAFLSTGESMFMPVKLDQKGNVKNTLSQDDLKGYISYAVRASELAVSQLKDGTIVASPYENTCEYCAFKGMCNYTKAKVRSLNSVKKQTIVDAVQKGGENG